MLLSAKSGSFLEQLSPTRHLHAKLWIPETTSRSEWIFKRFAIGLSYVSDKPLYQETEDLTNQRWDWHSRRRPAVNYALSGLDSTHFAKPDRFQPGTLSVKDHNSNLQSKSAESLLRNNDQFPLQQMPEQCCIQKWMEPLKKYNVLRTGYLHW